MTWGRKKGRARRFTASAGRGERAFGSDAELTDAAKPLHHVHILQDPPFADAAERVGEAAAPEQGQHEAAQMREALDHGAERPPPQGKAERTCGDARRQGPHGATPIASSPASRTTRISCSTPSARTTGRSIGRHCSVLCPSKSPGGIVPSPKKLCPPFAGSWNIPLNVP